MYSAVNFATWAIGEKFLVAKISRSTVYYLRMHMYMDLKQLLICREVPMHPCNNVLVVCGVTLSVHAKVLVLPL